MISKEEFCKLAAREIEFSLLKDIKIRDVTYYVFQVRIVPINEYYKSLKRHSEFESLYEALSMTFAQLDFPKPPSKFKIIHKIRRRKEFYFDLLRQVKSYMLSYPEYRELFLQKLYQFFMVECKPMGDKEIKNDVDFLVDNSIRREGTFAVSDEEENEESEFSRDSTKEVDSFISRGALYNTVAAEGYKVRENFQQSSVNFNNSPNAV